MCGLIHGELSHNCYGGWFYESNILSAEQNAAFAKQKGWNYVFFSGEVRSNSGRTNLINNINAFHKENISFHIMTLQDTTFIDKPSEAVESVNKILDFVAENKLPISGIHIDTEPHAHDNWDSNDFTASNAIFQKYISMIEQVRVVIDNKNPNLLFSAAVAWWYSAQTSSGNLQQGRGFDLVKKTRLDLIVPMIYDGAGGSVEKVMSRSKDYIADQAATVCGMDVRDYSNNELFSADVEGVFSEMAKDGDRAKYFYGVSTFSNTRYYDWPAGTAGLKNE